MKPLIWYQFTNTGHKWGSVTWSLIIMYNKTCYAIKKQIKTNEK